MNVETYLNSFFYQNYVTYSTKKAIFGDSSPSKRFKKTINLARMQVLTLNHGHRLRARSWGGSKVRRIKHNNFFQTRHSFNRLTDF